MEKNNTTALGLHLVPGSADGILAYSDGIADVAYEHLDTAEDTGGKQSDINKELRDGIITSQSWIELD